MNERSEQKSVQTENSIKFNENVILSVLDRLRLIHAKFVRFWSPDCKMVENNWQEAVSIVEVTSMEK